MGPRYIGSRREPVKQEEGINRPAAYLDPQSDHRMVTMLHGLLEAGGLLRSGPLETCDIVLCSWPRYEHFRRLREARGLGFRLNQIPHVTERLHQKQRFARHFRRKRYVPRTYLESGPRRLRGMWVEKPFNLDCGEGIRFLRDPRGWQREEHVLQRYVEDPWLVDGRKTEVRVLARIDDDGTARVHEEGLVRVAHRPFTPDDLDPLVHNANSQFQMKRGVDQVEQHLFTEVLGRLPLERMVAIVHETVTVMRRKRRFRGTRDFEAMGYDFVLDAKHRPHLLEANRFHGIYFEPEACARFYRGMLPALYGDL